jgi:hypothetical protein
MDIDISQLDFGHLKELRDACNTRMKDMREIGTEQLRLKFIEDAAALGLAPEDIFGAPKKRRRRRRHKDDDEQDQLSE